ncbi:FLJ37770-like protein [Trichonephila clavipes]|nr:FLJ37770-like protein [Trichonephila clavipes]
MAKTVGRQYSSIQCVIYKFKSTRVYTSKPRLGRPSKLTIRVKRSGKDAVEDDQRRGRSISSRTTETIEKVRNFVANDRCAPLRMMSDSLKINKETIRIIMDEDLGKTKVCAKFVLRILYREQKAMRSAHCKRHPFSG